MIDYKQFLNANLCLISFGFDTALHSIRNCVHQFLEQSLVTVQRPPSFNDALFEMVQVLNFVRSPPKEIDKIKIINIQGVPKENPFIVLVAGTRSELWMKVGSVLENSGYFLSNEYKNFTIPRKKAEKNEVKHGSPPLINDTIKSHTVVPPLPAFVF